MIYNLISTNIISLNVLWNLAIFRKFILQFAVNNTLNKDLEIQLNKTYNIIFLV